MIKLGEQSIVMRNGADLTPNPWNPNEVGVENMEKLKTSLQHNGFFKPILLRELDDGTLEIIGGKHRVDAAIELGIMVPTINLGTIDDIAAKKFTLMDNDSYGENDSMLLSKVLADLTEAGEDVLSEMTYSDEELSDLVNLTTSVNVDVLDELDNLDLDAPDEPELPRTDTLSDKDEFKTIKLKVDIALVEEFEDWVAQLAADHEFEDSDMAVVRGKLFHALMSSEVNE